MARRKAARALESLERIARRYGPGLAAGKLALLAVLADSMLETAGQLRKLHELLCFLDAYPDNRRIRSQVRRMLRGFATRRDLRRNRSALAGSGIAGTDIPYRFFWPTAEWIARLWPGALVLDRDDEEAIREILAAIPPLLEPAQSEWLFAQHPKDLAPVDRLVPHGMTDADFIISLIAAMPGDEFSREAFGDRLDLSYILRAGRNTPERTTTRLDRLPVHFQTCGLQHGYPDLRLEARRAPRRIQALRGDEALATIRLARISMITRERDLAAFQFPEPRDVLLIDVDRGLGFALMGMIPERRAMLPATYTALTLQNGVPIGYVQVEVLGRHGALSFNTFETFRGGEAAWIFSRFIATARHLFGCSDFSVEPYQLGAGNDEGIESGAWWFYHRLGFRPRDTRARRIAARELARRAANKRYRSSPRTLRVLAQSHLFYSLIPGRQARLPRSQHWLNSAATISRRYGQRDPQARREATVADTLTRLGRKKALALKPPQRAMLARWAPLALALMTTGRWRIGDRNRLLRLILAKANSSERDFQRQLLRDRRLRSLLNC